jgi:hypothetical protein
MATSDKPRRMLKVRVNLTITIDVDDYSLNYGIDDFATIRDDVRWAISDAVNSGAVLHNGIADVQLNNLSR